jgi:steroid 5-alpha reductase family enzyme
MFLHHGYILPSIVLYSTLPAVKSGGFLSTNSIIMRKIIESAIGLIILFAIVLAGAQKPDGGIDVAWTLAMLAIAVVFSLILNMLGHEGEETKIKALDE